MSDEGVGPERTAQLRQMHLDGTLAAYCDRILHERGGLIDRLAVLLAARRGDLPDLFDSPPNTWESRFCHLPNP